MRAAIRQTNVRLLFYLFVVAPIPALIPFRFSCADEITMSSEWSNDPAYSSANDPAFMNETLHLDTVLTYAQEHNPSIQAAHSRLLAAQERPAQVSALDDPTFTYEGFNIPEYLDLTRTDNTILKLSQKFLFPGKRQLRGQIATLEAEMTREELRRVQVQVRAEVKKSYYGLWRVHENLRISARDKEFIAQFATIVEKKYAVGQAAQSDVLRAQVELTRLITRVTSETRTLDATRAMLNTLLSRPPDAPLGVPQAPTKPVVQQTFAELAELTLRTRPEIVVSAVANERETKSLTLAQKAYLPDFEMYVERFINSGRRDGFGLMFSATIPFAFREKYDAGVAEARARLDASTADQRAMRDKALAEVKRALVRAQTASELVNLFRQTHLPQAEQALASSQISYQTGKIDFLSLLDSLRVVEQVHLEQIAAAADFEQTYADLEQAVGQALPRKSQ